MMAIIEREGPEVSFWGYNRVSRKVNCRSKPPLPIAAVVLSWVVH